MLSLTLKTLVTSSLYRCILWSHMHCLQKITHIEAWCRENSKSRLQHRWSFGLKLINFKLILINRRREESRKKLSYGCMMHYPQGKPKGPDSVRRFLSHTPLFDYCLVTSKCTRKFLCHHHHCNRKGDDSFAFHRFPAIAAATSAFPWLEMLWRPKYLRRVIQYCIYRGWLFRRRVIQYCNHRGWS